MFARLSNFEVVGSRKLSQPLSLEDIILMAPSKLTVGIFSDPVDIVAVLLLDVIVPFCRVISHSFCLRRVVLPQILKLHGIIIPDSLTLLRVVFSEFFKLLYSA